MTTMLSTAKRRIIIVWALLVVVLLFCKHHRAAAAVLASTTARRSLIVRGEDAARGRYPYFVTLERYGAGALIASDIVLMAGHTFPDRRDRIKPRVGTYSFEDDVDEYEEFDIVDGVRHPRFTMLGDNEFFNDFSVLKLSGHSKAPVVSINRDPAVPANGQKVVVMGLGTLDDESGERPDVLQQATLRCIENDACGNISDPDRGISFAGRIHDTHVCTVSEPNNERDACNNDSGGPIIIPGIGGASNNTNGTNSTTTTDDLLVALVSWGIGCADPVFPGVNSRVSAASEWIDRAVCGLSENPPADFRCGTLTKTPGSRERPMSFVWMACAAALAVAVVAIASALVKRRYDNSSKNGFFFSGYDQMEINSLSGSSRSSDGSSVRDYQSTEEISIPGV